MKLAPDLLTQTPCHTSYTTLDEASEQYFAVKRNRHARGFI